jgi:Flp pilus assembly protein TadB
VSIRQDWDLADLREELDRLASLREGDQQAAELGGGSSYDTHPDGEVAQDPQSWREPRSTANYRAEQAMNSQYAALALVCCALLILGTIAAWHPHLTLYVILATIGVLIVAGWWCGERPV